MKGASVVIRPPAGVTVPIQSGIPGCVLSAQKWTSLEVPQEMFRCRRVNLNRLAHGSLTNSIEDVEAIAFS